jgi:hypothetical protein
LHDLVQCQRALCSPALPEPSSARGGESSDDLDVVKTESTLLNLVS